MQQRHGYRKGSKWFCNISRRQYIRIRNLLLLTILLIFIVCGCIVHIDDVCGIEPRDLPALPEAVQPTPAIAEKVEPAAPVYDIPLSKDLQEYTYQKCIEYDVDYLMVLAIMDQESDYQNDLVSETGDYGIMQINESNFNYLTDALGEVDFLNPEQNIEAGIFWLSGICKNNSDPERILMVYKMNGSIAQELWDQGRYSTWYSRSVMRIMDEIRGKQVQV